MSLRPRNNKTIMVHTTPMDRQRQAETERLSGGRKRVRCGDGGNYLPALPTADEQVELDESEEEPRKPLDWG